MRIPPRFALAALLLLPVVGVACGGSDSKSTGSGSGSGSAASADHVSVIDNKFQPEEFEVAVGDTVTWKFEGAALHNVHGDGFSSDNKKSGTFEHQFNSAGSYDYVCTLHPGMKGKIQVG